MKFNTTYNQNISFKKTIKEISKIKSLLIDFYNNKYSIFEVLPPSVSKEGDEKNINFDLITRSVSFDIGTSGVIAENIISHTNWARDILKRLKVKIDEGIYFTANSILRDIEENTYSSTTRTNLSILIKINNKSVDEEIEEKTNELYSLIFKMAQQFEKKYKIKNIYPKNPIYISSQQMENELPNLTFKEREDDFILSEEAIFLKEAGTILFSGKVHSFIPKEVYDLKRYNQIILKDRINTEGLKVASVGVLASGVQLSDQLALYGMSILTSSDFYKNIINDDNKYIEIRINIPRLVLALLSKGHISEVQPEVLSEEAETIKIRHGIEKY